MINLANALRDEPHLFISGLPAGEFVDQVLTQHSGLWSYRGTHQGSAAALEATPVEYRDEFLSMCANPETLLVAATTLKSTQCTSIALVNPLTPRTADVIEATRSADQGTLQENFADFLSHDLASHYDPATHADLLQRVAENPEHLSWSYDTWFDIELTALHQVPDVDALFTNHPEAAKILGQAIENNKAEAVAQCTIAGTTQSIYGRDPRTLSPAEREEVRKHIELDYKDKAKAPRHEPMATYTHLLHLHELIDNKERNLDDIWVDAHAADYTPVWVQEWVDAGLMELPGDMRSTGAPALPAVGRYLWDELGGSTPAMTLALDLLNGEWPGTLQELAETVKSSMS